MKVEQLRTLLASTLTDYNSYFGDNVGDYGEYPYKINYQIQSTNFANRYKVYFVDFDVYSQNDITVEQITDNLEDIFTNNTHYINNSEALFLYQSRYNADDKNTYRRTLSFEVHTFDSQYEKEVTND